MAKTHLQKDKGNVGELACQLAFAKKGYTVLYPQSEHASYDFVVEKEGNFLRVQAKYREINKYGNMRIKFVSQYTKGGKIVRKPVDKTEIDVYAIYCPDTEKVYYLDPNEYTTSVSIRVETEGRRITKNTNLSTDFEELPKSVLTK